MADAADEGHHDHDSGGAGTQRLRGDDLVVQRGEPARHAGEEAREHDHQIPDPLRIEADELDALGIVAHRVRHLAQRRVGEEVHADDAEEGPSGDQVVHLQRRPVGDAEPARRGHAVAGEATLAAEEAGEHERARRHHLADAERDHCEGGPGAPGSDVAEGDAEEQPRDPARERKKRDG